MPKQNKCCRCGCETYYWTHGEIICSVCGNVADPYRVHAKYVESQTTVTELVTVLKQVRAKLNQEPPQVAEALSILNARINYMEFMKGEEYERSN